MERIISTKVSRFTNHESPTAAQISTKESLSPSQFASLKRVGSTFAGTSCLPLIVAIVLRESVLLVLEVRPVPIEKAGMGCVCSCASKARFEEIPSRGKGDAAPFQSSNDSRVQCCSTSFSSFASKLNEVRLYHQEAPIQNHNGGKVIMIRSIRYALCFVSDYPASYQMFELTQWAT